ncbi:MAG: hypothetical protein M0R06_24740 [Sphaerochaeta sp.]|nr:hypothetical protein [Sphaerochaeta sp.]
MMDKLIDRKQRESAPPSSTPATEGTRPSYAGYRAPDRMVSDDELFRNLGGAVEVKRGN